MAKKKTDKCSKCGRSTANATFIMVLMDDDHDIITLTGSYEEVYREIYDMANTVNDISFKEFMAMNEDDRDEDDDQGEDYDEKFLYADNPELKPVQNEEIIPGRAACMPGSASAALNLMVIVAGLLYFKLRKYRC